MLPTFPEGNVQCQDGSLTPYAAAKVPGVDRESDGLPASGPFSLYIHADWAGSPSSMVSRDCCSSGEYNRQSATACATWFRDANDDDMSNVGCRRIVASTPLVLRTSRLQR
jgi:hypothetical protein